MASRNIEQGIDAVMAVLQSSTLMSDRNWLRLADLYGVSLYLHGAQHGDLFVPNPNGGFLIVGLRPTEDEQFRAAGAPVVEAILRRVEQDRGWQFRETDAAWMIDWCLSECWQMTRNRALLPGITVRIAARSKRVAGPVVADEWAVNDGEFSE